MTGCDRMHFNPERQCGVIMLSCQDWWLEARSIEKGSFAKRIPPHNRGATGNGDSGGPCLLNGQFVSHHHLQISHHEHSAFASHYGTEHHLIAESYHIVNYHHHALFVYLETLMPYYWTRCLSSMRNCYFLVLDPHQYLHAASQLHFPSWYS